MDIDFEEEIQEATFYNPLEDFDKTTTEITVRKDPLTGEQTRIVPDSFILPEREPDIDEVVSDDEGCFFCPEMVGEATPKYPDFVGTDRGSVGEATSFPNLNPYSTHSNVVVVTEDHYVPIRAFTPTQFADGFQAALEYVTAVFEADETAEVASVNMNYLRPAGSSIVHPHLQTVVDDRGTNAQQIRFEAARAYREHAGSDYWADLLVVERDGDRWIGSSGSVSWIAPFAPVHHRHVLGIADSIGVPEPDSPTVEDLGDGLVRVLEYFGELGLNSFNVALHVVDDPAIRPIIDVVARSVFDRYYWSDATFFETIHRESVIDVGPETYAKEVAEFF